MTPVAGQVLFVERAASIQFASRPITFRVIRVLDQPTYDGWAWLDGYQLNAAGDAVARRSIFVMLGGLRPGRAGETPRPRVRPAGVLREGVIYT